MAVSPAMVRGNAVVLLISVAHTVAVLVDIHAVFPAEVAYSVAVAVAGIPAACAYAYVVVAYAVAVLVKPAVNITAPSARGVL